jgi:hypothetical protein
MRLALLLPVLISVAAPAYADGARESRYGPTTPRQTNAAAARYDGPMLGWANKRQVATAPAAPTATAPTPPAPLANWAGYQAAPAPVAYTPAPVPTAQTPPIQTPPTSLYAAPRPTPVAAASPPPAKDWSSYRSSRVANVATAPAPAPATAPLPPAAPRQVAAANTGGTGARFYSVDRDYGLTPDAAPPTSPDNRVLITASEPPPEPKDAIPMHGSADWLAAGVNGDDGDDSSSAERRAKTRNQAQ